MGGPVVLLCAHNDTVRARSKNWDGFQVVCEFVDNIAWYREYNKLTKVDNLYSDPVVKLFERL